jgi:hypothetical protein
MKTTVKSIIGSVAILTTLAVSSYGQKAKIPVSTVHTIKSAGIAVAGEEKLPGNARFVEGIRVDPLSVSQEKVTEGKISPQETLSIQRSRRFDFDDESTVAETKIKATDEYNALLIAVATSLNQGSIVVDILDPKGVKQGTFTLVADEPSVVGGKTKYTGSVAGQMQKQFRFPIKGEWIIRATPTTAKGFVDLRIEQRFIPNLDYIQVGIEK